MLGRPPRTVSSLSVPKRRNLTYLFTANGKKPQLGNVAMKSVPATNAVIYTTRTVELTHWGYQWQRWWCIIFSTHWNRFPTWNGVAMCYFMLQAIPSNDIVRRSIPGVLYPIWIPTKIYQLKIMILKLSTNRWQHGSKIPVSKDVLCS